MIFSCYTIVLSLFLLCYFFYLDGDKDEVKLFVSAALRLSFNFSPPGAMFDPADQAIKGIGPGSPRDKKSEDK